MNDKQLARGLGWFSIGLGLAEVIAPKRLGKLIGVRGHEGLLQLFGLREITAGVGLLTAPNNADPLAKWMWARVGGDALDLAMLGAAFRSRRAKPNRLIVATAAVAGVTALDVLNSTRLGRTNGSVARGGAMQVKQSITINRAPEELYRFWRDFQNLPRFMKHLESVRPLEQDEARAMRQAADQSSGRTVPQATSQGGGDSSFGARSHWVAKAPAGRTVEWDAEITEDRPNELIAWRSLEGADVDNTGTVKFKPAVGGRGTVVEVEMSYDPPGGALGATVAKLFGENPDWQVKDDLRRFKQVMEIGEVITTEGQPAGRDSSTSPKYDGAVRE